MNFRVDRILRRPVILEEDAVPLPADFDMNDYLNSMTRMYDGERCGVTFLCGNDVVNAFIDRYGREIGVEPVDEEHFRTTVEAAVGPGFYGWVFGFGGKVLIEGPDDVREKYAAMVRRALDGVDSGGKGPSDAKALPSKPRFDQRIPEKPL